ncbi:MAG: hypothetical protein AAB481_00765 [Patescibacteria group bacterium]
MILIAVEQEFDESVTPDGVWKTWRNLGNLDQGPVTIEYGEVTIPIEVTTTGVVINHKGSSGYLYRAGSDLLHDFGVVSLDDPALEVLVNIPLDLTNIEDGEVVLSIEQKPMKERAMERYAVIYHREI